MKVKFIVPRRIDGILYNVGVHQMDDVLAGHWYLLAVVANGQALVVEGPAKQSLILNKACKAGQSLSLDPGSELPKLSQAGKQLVAKAKKAKAAQEVKAEG